MLKAVVLSGVLLVLLNIQLFVQCLCIATLYMYMYMGVCLLFIVYV